MSIAQHWNLSLTIKLHDGQSYCKTINLDDLLTRSEKTSANQLDASQNACVIQSWVRQLKSDASQKLAFELTIRNPSAMDHPNGNWDLGASGNVLIQCCELTFTPKSEFSLHGLTIDLIEQDEQFAASESLSIYQASSGGEAWQSNNHLDRSGTCVPPFRGYSLKCDERTIQGDRATPIVNARIGEEQFSLGVKYFWQNFPIQLSATKSEIKISLLASEESSPTELQGGEQKTFEIAFEQSTVDGLNHLRNWLEHGDKPSEEEIEVVRKKWPHLLPRSADSDERYEQLADLAIEGDDSFFDKREIIDEYGWRHFGDVWGDHEAVFHRGDSPMISHYNNQYDCTLGFAIQYLRTGDDRWWDLMIPMADHAWDIDTYHTDQDKLLYNGGLFWHTYHYADAHTATHRSYPQRLRMVNSFEDGKDLSSMGSTGEKLTKNYQVGGGPAASHNYSTGWLLAYYLTGKERYKEAAISAADYVMGLEDGGSTPFKWLSRNDTGYSTCSADGYYGPGRASANSTHALLTGHELTGDERYLARAQELMRRTVHPKQDLDQLDLLNAELRWFYTMYLQSLCRYLDYKVKLNQIDGHFRFGVASIRHYANWMSEHERPTLSEPDQLQYPTETWAAQDMRKWHVLEHASRYASDETSRSKMQKKADFFYNYVVQHLNQSPTKTLCRPVVLMHNFGWQREWFLTNRDTVNYTEVIDDPFGEPPVFIPQRAIAVGRFKKILTVLAIACTGLTLLGIHLVLKSLNLY